jgi:hypothetical protein
VTVYNCLRFEVGLTGNLKGGIMLSGLVGNLLGVVSGLLSGLAGLL